jgi:hypothetical protein
MSSIFSALMQKIILTYDTRQFDRADLINMLGLEINTAQIVDIHSINNVRFEYIIRKR